MGIAEMGRLTDFEIRDVWEHEAHDFTPWLAKNLGLLSEILGIELELEGTETPIVGGYRADILCRDRSDNSRVLIENQLEWADLHHLGQVMAYLSGLDAKVVVWIARGFQDAHLSALRWLNEHTTDEFAFFAIRIRAVKIEAPTSCDSKIKNSLPAPILDVIERPNDWDRQVRSGRDGLSELGELRRDFWAHYRDRHPSVEKPTPGFAGSNVNHLVKGLDVRISQYLGAGDSGIFLASPLGKQSAGLYEILKPYLSRLKEELEKAKANDHLGVIQGSHHNSRLDTNGYDRANWDKIADWLESRRQIYMKVLTGPPGDGEDATPGSDRSATS